MIDEFRVRGPSGANDEYVRIYNESASPHTVAAISGTGYAIAASDGVVRCTIPNGTVIPAFGHFLCVNSMAYSIAAYPAGNGTTATGDATYTTDIPDNAGIAIFNNNTGGGSFILANRLDAVGSTSEANTLYKEGTGYAALTPFSIDYAFTRDICGKQGSITNLTACLTAGTAIDSGNNATDFYFVDTNGTSAGAGQRLGAPGPANLSSPVIGTAVTHSAFDSCSINSIAPNTIRDFTSDPANNSTFGTLDIRRTFTNTSGVNLTRLRFRVIDLTTFPAPSGFADLRPRTSTSVVVTVDRPPCGSGTSNVTVQGTTLEQPPSQPNGGGFNSSMSAGTVTLGTPLAAGASIDLRFLMGIQQTGQFKLGLLIEGLPQGGSLYEISGCTDGCGPTVVSSNRVNPDPTNAASVQYTVTFDQSVTGVDAADFSLTTTGAVAGASITGVSGSGAVYTVTVNTGTGDGTIRLNVVDNDTILAGGIPLGGTGVGNGSFTTGQVYTVDKTAPTVTVNQAGGQIDPAAASPINFTVTFGEAVTGFTNGDIVLGGTAGATTAIVSGGPTVYNVAVSGMTGNGSVIVSVNGGAAADAAGNVSATSTSTDNTVTFTGGAVAPGEPTAIPTMDTYGLMMLALMVVGGAFFRRRNLQ